jgi:hypothetical protein
LHEPAKVSFSIERAYNEAVAEFGLVGENVPPPHRRALRILKLEAYALGTLR